MRKWHNFQSNHYVTNSAVTLPLLFCTYNDSYSPLSAPEFRLILSLFRRAGPMTNHTTLSVAPTVVSRRESGVCVQLTSHVANILLVPQSL